MWIVPKRLDTYPCVQDTMASGLDSKEQGLILASLFMWRSKPSQATTWSRRLKANAWVREFSGQILKRSPSKSFEDALISCLADSRASPLAKQEKGSGTKTLDIYSPTSEKESKTASPQSYSSKTSKESFQPSSKETTGTTQPERPFCSMSLENWKDWVTEQRQSRRARQKSVLLTRETDGSLLAWPTASVAGLVEGGINSKGFFVERKNGTRYGAKLRDSVIAHEKTWPTPAARDVKGLSGSGRQERKGNPRDTLPNAVLLGLPAPAKTNSHGNRPESLESTKRGTTCKKPDTMVTESWLTPRATEPDKDSGAVKRNEDRGAHCFGSLNHQGKEKPPGNRPESWGTPQARDHKSGRGKQERVYKDLAPQVERPTQGKLNPRWVETLMGLPVGWVMPSCTHPVTVVPMNSGSLETESCLSPAPMPFSKDGKNSWATPNTMDHLNQRSFEAMKRHATSGGRTGRAKPSNLREQVDPEMCRAYEEAVEENKCQ